MSSLGKGQGLPPFSGTLVTGNSRNKWVLLLRLTDKPTAQAQLAGSQGSAFEDRDRAKRSLWRDPRY